MPHRRVMVANLGVNGYSGTNYERVLVQKGVVERPHLVVVGFNINDFPNITQRVDQEVFQGKKTLRSRIPSDMRDRLGETALFRWLRATYYELRREQDWKTMERVAAKAAESFDPVNAAGLGPELIRSIVQTAQEGGAQIATFLFPYESMIYLDDYNRTPSERIHAVTDRLGVPFIDIAERFRDVAHQTSPPHRLFIRGDRYHPNAEGYEIVARAVFGAVKDRGWLEPPQ
jgi:lysophospholipase L1-like esterase